MFCGTGSFSHVDEDPAAVKKKKGCSRSGGGSSRRRSKNPYSTRGLDKFSKVISELEEKREKIMARAAVSHAGVAMVRFMYSNSQDWIPIIVKLREEPLPLSPARKSNSKKPQPTAPLPLPLPPPQATVPAEPATEREVMKKTLTRRMGECWKRWRPNYYWPVVLIVILMCLVMFGRVFAICCTSIWWYLSPTLMGCDDQTNLRKKRPAGCGNPVVAHPPPSRVQELTSPRSHHVNGRKG